MSLTVRWSIVYHHINRGQTVFYGEPLHMLSFRILLCGSALGLQIAKHIQRTTNDFLQTQHVSLYPALYWLEERA